ncbi:LacI family DNA-binding transcriptional regulator [Haliangium ochraceum]|uniref:Transcriptional regulator, LacI family n=1 Tax=Haliangium ochraceum (strain DSM 14365 / JCM 11303 / SMP-2) TaxID=502025 RepID=D0LPZ4_HALO1|nr:LacI family DNA-binding transcriptional regulator [Haliangium ochraceum]ACY17031.1 transcriptional regulator, LacI family [Haliangium ochraceum DSM 14365]
MSVSIKDIARAAGVSHSTVSRALRDSPLIRLETRERVQRIAREMGYTPNAVAQGLRSQRTDTIGLVIASIADPYYAKLVRGAESVAEEQGLSVLISSSYGEPERERRAIETSLRRRVDGLLVASSRPGSALEGQLAQRAGAVVAVNPETPALAARLCSVAVDNQDGARQIVAHAIELGHRRIGYLGVSDRALTDAQRERGWRAALAAAGIEPEPAWLARSEVSDTGTEDSLGRADVVSAEALAPRLLAAGMTALCCYNDMMATGALLACRRQGVRVPEDCSVLGFDDIDLARYVSPPLTTVRQDIGELGRVAMRAVLARMAGQPVEDQLLATALVTRASSAPPPSPGSAP